MGAGGFLWAGSGKGRQDMEAVRFKQVPPEQRADHAQTHTACEIRGFAEAAVQKRDVRAVSVDHIALKIVAVEDKPIICAVDGLHDADDNVMLRLLERGDVILGANRPKREREKTANCKNPAQYSWHRFTLPQRFRT